VVLAEESEFTEYAKGDEHFVKLDGISQVNANSDDFAFVQDGGRIVGWEASFTPSLHTKRTNRKFRPLKQKKARSRFASTVMMRDHPQNLNQPFLLSLNPDVVVMLIAPQLTLVHARSTSAMPAPAKLCTG
jgi:hypothetical protein